MQRLGVRHVYFMQPVGMATGPVKIGCSHVPEQRRLDLTKWSPFKLEIVAKMQGDFTLERRLHARFWEQHSHQEWFTWSPDLQAVIDAVASGTFDTESLPEPISLHLKRAA